MSLCPQADAAPSAAVQKAADHFFQRQRQRLFKRTDHMFAVLMVCQWIGAIAAAVWISPRAWHGSESETHLHVWTAVFLGGAIASAPIYLALRYAGKTYTRHTIAVAPSRAFRHCACRWG